MYNDQSVLENHHLAVAFKLLQQEGADIFENLSTMSYRTVRRIAIDIVSELLRTKHIIGHIGDDFYGSDDPTNSVKALKDNSWSVHQLKVQSHQAKPHYKVKSEDTEVLGGLRARPNEIKPDPVDQPERTAHYDCATCITEMLHNTRL